MYNKKKRSFILTSLAAGTRQLSKELYMGAHRTASF